MFALNFKQIGQTAATGMGSANLLPKQIDRDTVSILKIIATEFVNYVFFFLEGSFSNAAFPTIIRSFCCME